MEIAVAGLLFLERSGVDSARMKQEEAPLNPFEAAFSLIKLLRDEIQELKVEMKEMRITTEDRFESIESSFTDFKTTASMNIRCLQSDVEQVKLAKISRFEKMEETVELLRSAKTKRFEVLEGQFKNETLERLASLQALDKKLVNRFKDLDAKWEKNTIAHTEHKENVKAINLEDRKRHDDLRQDLEKLAALLSCSSLTRDPFQELGYKASASTHVSTELGRTTHSSLPPVFGASPRGLGKVPDGSTTAASG